MAGDRKWPIQHPERIQLCSLATPREGYEASTFGNFDSSASSLSQLAM